MVKYKVAWIMQDAHITKLFDLHLLVACIADRFLKV